MVNPQPEATDIIKIFSWKYIFDQNFKSNFHKGSGRCKYWVSQTFLFSNILIPFCNMKEMVQNSLVWWYVNFELWPPENSNPTEIRETINIAANLNAIPLIYKELWRHILIFIVTASRVDIFQKLPISEYQVTKLEIIAQNHNKMKVLWFLRLTVKRQKVTDSPNKL